MPRILLAAGAVLLAIAVILALTLRRPHEGARSVTVTIPTTAPATTTAPAPTTTAPATTTTAPPPPPPPTVPMSWQSAGAIVWHATDVDPAVLGDEMRAAGFGWLAVSLDVPPDADWISRFRQASGLPVGGWSVLGGDPSGDAATAVRLIGQDGLAFYIADAEAPYGYSAAGGSSSIRFRRSSAFVTAFRAAEPSLPAAVSSYCRPDQHDLDWSAWVKGGFDFLPQAYVNDFSGDAAPAACVLGAAKWFPRSKVHPTVASYAGAHGFVQPARWVQLLRAAGTTGFSVYPAEVGMSSEDWQTYGQALPGLAKKP